MSDPETDARPLTAEERELLVRTLLDLALGIQALGSMHMGLVDSLERETGVRLVRSSSTSEYFERMERSVNSIESLARTFGLPVNA